MLAVRRRKNSRHPRRLCFQQQQELRTRFFPHTPSPACVCAQGAAAVPPGHQTEPLFQTQTRVSRTRLRDTDVSASMSSSSSDRTTFPRSPSPPAMVVASSTAERAATFSPKVTGIPCVAVASRYTAPVHIDVGKPALHSPCLSPLCPGGTIYTSSLETLTKYVRLLPDPLTDPLFQTSGLASREDV